MNKHASQELLELQVLCNLRCLRVAKSLSWWCDEALSRGSPLVLWTESLGAWLERNNFNWCVVNTARSIAVD